MLLRSLGTKFQPSRATSPVREEVKSFKSFLIANNLAKALDIYVTRPRDVHRFFLDELQCKDISVQTKEAFLKAAADKLKTDQSMMAPFMLSELIHSLQKSISPEVIQKIVNDAITARLEMRDFPDVFLSFEFLDSSTAFGTRMEGNGSTVSFYKTKDGKEVAVKETSDPAIFLLLLEEYHAYRLLPDGTEDLEKSQNLIRAMGLYYMVGDKLSLVMECASQGDLVQILSKKNRGFNEDEIIKVAYESSKGLSFLHKNGLVHQDIKPDNIFLDGNGTIKIGDLGSLKKISDDQLKIRHSTPLYTELSVLLINKSYDTKIYNKYLKLIGKKENDFPRAQAFRCTFESDMYGLIVTLIVMMLNKDPFQVLKQEERTDSNTIIECMFQGNTAFKEEDIPPSHCLKTYLIRGIQHDPSLRLSTEEMINVTKDRYKKLGPNFMLV